MRKALSIAAGLAALTLASVGAAPYVTSRPAATPNALLAPPARGGSVGDRMVRKAEFAMQHSPSRPEGLNLLAAGFMKKARETGSAGFTAQAEEALDRSLALAPDNREALGLRAALLVSLHRFGEGLAVARRVVELEPDSPSAYGTMVDALVELGRYDEAVEAAQTMVNLRPDGGSYARAAHLRALHGDTEGAIEALVLAVGATDPTDAESIAWCRVRLGNLLINSGRRTEGEREIDLALDAMPGFHLALASKARVRAIAGDLDAAIDLYGRASERVPLPDFAIARGDLYTVAGRPAEAKQQYELAEAIERASGQPASPLMALHWARHGERLDEALTVARRALEERADVYSYDLLAFCLYRTGDLSGAKSAIAQALRLGTRDPRIRYHAGLITGDDRHLRIAKQALVGFDESHASFTILDSHELTRMNTN